MPVFASEEQWLIDDQPLSTWAYNIESIGGRQGVPTLAGSNVSVPFRPGEVWKQKLAAPRMLSLGMWIRSSDAEGITPRTATGRRAQFNENLRSLKNIFYKSDRLLTLTKSVRYLDGVKFFTTKAELMSNLEPTMLGANFGKMVVDLKMPDPFWVSGPLISNNISFGGTIVNNPGDDITYKIVMQITMGGPTWGSGTTIIKNLSYDPVITFSIPTPAPGTTWTIDVENFFVAFSGDFSTNWQGSISNRSGSPFWMELKKGDNRISVDSRYGQGSFNPIGLRLTYYPVYL